METFNVYEDVATRTGGDIFIGVVGPVRTGKSTFIKKFMEALVLPSVEGAKKQRYTDELPQSAAGKTVMTTEPKFVPEEAAEIKVKDAVARVRLIDCVGFPVEGAAGFEEEGAPRLVKTPWNDRPVPFEEAAEEGTRRVVREHATIGILVTTDGSIAGLSRSAYEKAEQKAVEELKKIGKPFVILINCVDTMSAMDLSASLQAKYEAPALAVNLEALDEAKITEILERVLYEFPVVSIDVDIPDWMRILEADSPVISELLSGIRAVAPKISKLSDCALLDEMFAESDRLKPPVSMRIDAATGVCACRVEPQEGTFLKVLGEECGEELEDEFALMRYAVKLSEAKKVYDRVGKAFADAKEYGYGIVPPEPLEMSLSEPKLTKRNGRVDVNLHADAPSYHIIRVDVSGEVHPAIGTMEQSEAFVKSLSESMATEPEQAWNTSMFGRTLKEMLGEELSVKNRSMRENVQSKMRRTVTRIVNEGKGGVICILL